MSEPRDRAADIVGLRGDVDAHTVSLLSAACARYAIGLDERDEKLFLSAFTMTARCAVEADAADSFPSTVRVGHAEIAPLPSRLERYSKTHHMLGQHHFWMGADGPEGAVYCTARHLTRDPSGDTDLVMFIRYLDRYALSTDGHWLIDSRRVVIDWTEEHRVR